MPVEMPSQPVQHRLRDRSRGRNAALPIRHGRLKRSGPYGAIAKFVGAALAVVLVSTAGIAAYAVVDTVSSIKPGIHLASLPVKKGSGSASAAPAAPTSMDGAINVLLTGTDTRTGQGGQFNTAQELAGSSGAGNNDVTMVLHVSADHKNATVISIPRDTVVPIPACPNGSGVTPASSGDLFNTTLARGGLSCVVLTAEQLTGLNIPYAAEISFDGVVALSNAVGGVPVCLATPLVDPYVGLNLPAGEQTLAGAQALAYVRSRHGVGDGSDLGRISDQQLFLSSLMRKMTSAGVLSNPITLFSLAQAAVSNMQLSDTLTQPATIVSIALALKGISLSNMVFLQYPTIPDPADTAHVIPDPVGAAALTAAMAADKPVQLSGAVGPATVLATPAPGGSAAPASPATTTPAPTTPSAGASPGATPPGTPATPGTPGATPAAGGAVTLPSTATGQTAAEQTCTKGN